MAASYSIILPAYNDAAGLARHFDYFAARGEEIQLVVVDDCSTDDTEAVVGAATLPDNITLTYHRMAQNGGPAPARNKGLELASNELVLFLDADDILAPSFFDYMRLAPWGEDVDFVMFKYHLSPSAETPFTYNMHKIDRIFFSKQPTSDFPMPIFRIEDRPEAAATVNFPWNKLYRRQFLLDAQITFPDLRMHEDITPNWHAFLRCHSFGILYWAPPLITHFEAAGGERATNYVGEKRLAAFDELARIEEELLDHPRFGVLQPVFAAFCDDLFTWMENGLCDQGGPGSGVWRGRYREAAEAFWQNAQTARPEEEIDLDEVLEALTKQKKKEARK